MSSASTTIGNASGFVVRQKINEAFAALASNSSSNTEPIEKKPFQFWVDTSGSTAVLKIRNAADNAWIKLGDVSDGFGLKAPTAGNSAPSGLVPYLPWVDTSGTNPILKIRNAANDGWLIIGRVDVANYGLMPTTGGIFSGAISFSNKDHIKVPVGSNTERPLTPENGMIRYNSDTNSYEGYSGSAWSPIGGGGGVPPIQWHPFEGNSAQEKFILGGKSWAFETGAQQRIQCIFQVPNSYILGSQLILRLGTSSSSSSGKYKFEVTTTLVKENTDSIFVNTNTLVSSIETTINVANSVKYQLFSITDASGKINSMSVSKNDILKIVVKRINASSSEDVSDVHLIDSLSGVS